MNKTIYLGSGQLHFTPKNVHLKEVKIQEEAFYKIENVNAMPPFFMSVVSNSNHWMFVSSNGALSAGEKNSEHALFPYYTDDKITESTDHTGCKTIVLATKKKKPIHGNPFRMHILISSTFNATYTKIRMGIK